MHLILYMSKQSTHSLHNILTCNGMHVDAVDTIELQCRFHYMKIRLKALNYFELEETSK